MREDGRLEGSEYTAARADTAPVAAGGAMEGVASHPRWARAPIGTDHLPRCPPIGSRITAGLAPQLPGDRFQSHGGGRPKLLAGRIIQQTAQQLAASILAGALWSVYGPAAAFLAGAGFTAVSLLGYLVVRSRIHAGGMP